jgi:protein TonB
MARAVSVLVHLVILLVLVVIPLLDIVLPVPAMTMPSYVLAAPLPPPPGVVPHSVARPSAPANTGAAPTKAPDRLTPESPSRPSYAPPDPVDGGVPGDLGGVPGGLTPPVAPPVLVEPPAPRPGPVRVAQLPEPPRKTVDVHPFYPDIARSARVEGIVVLEAVIDTAGRVTQLRVLRSVPLLDQAAMDAVRQWRYTPSTLGGRPVSVLMTVTVRFTLQQ